MAFPSFPIFTVRVHKDFVFAGGGGGDVSFGKQNGVVVFDLTTYRRICYFTTNDDIIDRLAILDLQDSFSFDKYEPIVQEIKDQDNQDNEEIDENKENEEIEEIEENVNHSDSATNHYNSKNSKNLKNSVDSEQDLDSVINHYKSKNLKNSQSQQELPENHTPKSEEDSDSQKTIKITKNKDNKNLENLKQQNKHNPTNDNTPNTPPFAVVACGLENLYILNFSQNKLTLNQVVPIRATHLWTTGKSIIFATNKSKLYGFVNATTKIDLHGYETEKTLLTNTQPKNNNHIYYTPKTLKNYIFPFKGEKPCLENDWHSFYIIKESKKLGKVHKMGNRYCVPYKNNILMYNEQICEITHSDKLSLTTFYTKNEDSKLVILKDKIKEFRIPCITTLSVSECITAGNAEGYVYMINSSVNKMKVYDMCLTSAFCNKNYVYFTSFNGLVDRKKITNGRRNILILLLLTILISLLVSYIKY